MRREVELRMLLVCDFCHVTRSTAPPSFTKPWSNVVAFRAATPLNSLFSVSRCHSVLRKPRVYISEGVQYLETGIPADQHVPA